MTLFLNDHERAYQLLCLSLAHSVSERDQQWLNEHLSICNPCREKHEQTQAVVSALKRVSIPAGAGLVQSTQRRVRALCLRDMSRRRRLRPIWISAAFASVWTACSTPYLWQSFDLTGHWLHIPDLLWQMGFLVAWFTPAMTGAAVALWLRPRLAHPIRGMARATA